MPTDQRFKELTEEQILLIWENFTLDHPDLVKNSSESFTDKTYDEKERQLVTGLGTPGESEIADPELPLIVN